MENKVSWRELTTCHEHHLALQRHSEKPFKLAPTIFYFKGSLTPTASSTTTHLAQYSVVRNLQQVLDQKIKTIVKSCELSLIQNKPVEIPYSVVKTRLNTQNLSEENWTKDINYELKHRVREQLYLNVFFLTPWNKKCSLIFLNLSLTWLFLAKLPKDDLKI